jgi:pyrroloquinoline quinone biosynthesis protein E
MRYGLREGVRFVFDEARRQHALLQPEGVQLLNETAAAVIAAGGDFAVLAQWFDGIDEADVQAMVEELGAALTPGERQTREPSLREDGTIVYAAQTAPAATGARPEPAPYGLLAELTYRCPLRCPYCSNPVDAAGPELETETWLRIIGEARELGVLQLHLSGGEPLARRDLTELVTQAARLGIYTNLVTSGIGLTEHRLAELREGGLDHVQLSIQDSRAEPADAIAGIKAHDRKRTVAALVRESGLPLSVNVVLHRHNVERLAEIAAYAAGLGAQRLELAHTQYYGWGLLNRASLMPTREQVAAADLVARSLRLDGIELVYVRPDYYDGVAKPCMNGWGSRQLVVAPNGDVLPCPAASVLPGLSPENVLMTSLSEIWYSSASFNRFRGTEWMREPCRSCPRKEIDFGGCRCQAFQLTGDAAATDPACALSPDHGLMAGLVNTAAPGHLLPRRVTA